MNARALLPIALAVALAGCATAAKPLRGEFADLSPHQAVQMDATGQLVRWGGRIESVHLPARDGDHFVAEFGPMRFEPELQQESAIMAAHNAPAMLYSAPGFLPQPDPTPP